MRGRAVASRVPPFQASVLGLVARRSYSLQRPCLMAAYAAALALLWLRPRPRPDSG
jgi:hypothetical protein